MVSLMNRTEPSAMAMLAPPGCMLEAEKMKACAAAPPSILRCGFGGNMEVIIDDKTGEALNPEGFGIDPIAGLQLKGFSGNQMAYRLGAGKNPSPMTEKETVASSTDP